VTVPRHDEELDPDDGTSLAAAIREAVTVGKSAAAEIRSDLDRAFGIVAERQADLDHYCRQPGLSAAARDVAEKFLKTTGELRQDVDDLLARQSATLDTLNIAFFGRTGSGKSSLMEALSRGTGKAISPVGQSDWTVDVRQVEWEACTLHDIPGINGWGRDRPREELEDVARRSVETADIVVLAFDNQSQHAAEFEKVAAWVESYGKPVVAILNCRNPLWRFPPRVPLAVHRRQLSKSVAQHVSNIVEGLGKIGLRDIPVVAIQTKRAVFACADENYVGPDAATFHEHRATHGDYALYRWSNIWALEQLLLSALSHNAASIRLGMLHGQLRGAIEGAIGDWTVSRDSAANVLEDFERTIEGVLAVVGRQEPEPRTGARKVLSLLGGELDLDLDAIEELERLRGAAFDVPREGDVTRLARHKLTAELGPLREASLANALTAVDHAMQRREMLKADELKAAAFDEAAIDQAVTDVVGHIGAYLEERVARTVADADDDLKARAEMEEDVAGNAGGRTRTFGRALGVGALGGSAAGALGGVALANFWNPLGWTSGAALVALAAGTVVSTFLGLFSEKARKAAESKRQEMRSAARAHARKQVNAAYDDLEARIVKHCAALSSAAAVAALQQPVHLAISLHRISAAADAALEEFGALQERLPAPGGSVRAFTAAVSRVEARRGVGRAADLWLGEDWVRKGDDPDADLQPLLHQPDPTLGDRLDAVWRQLTSGSPPSAGRRWLREAQIGLSEEPAAKPVIDEAARIADDDRPQIAVCGDYSAGKTSFIRRLLAEDYRPIPDELQTGGGPTTERATSYSWAGMRLIDTPGLQGGDERHDREAASAIRTAGAIVLLFNPNLVVGDDRFLTLALIGDEAAARPSKLPRTLFVINRCDELGVDPEEDVEGYRRLCDSKRNELVRALAVRQITISPDQVFCLASNPYGLVSDDVQATPEDFARTRAWDGVQEFVDAARGHRVEFAETGVDVAVLEVGSSGLRDASSALDRERTAAVDRRRVLERLYRDLRSTVRHGAAMTVDARVRLHRVVDDHVGGLWQELLAAEGAERRVLAERLQAWHEDKELLVEVEAWFNGVAADLETWSQDADDSLDRRVQGAAFARVFPDLGKTELDFLHPSSGHARKPADVVSRSAQALGKKEVVLDLGHRLGHKFRPWGATKAAARFAKAGAVLGAATFAWDVASFFRDEHAAAGRERKVQAVQDDLDTSIKAAVAAFADGDAQDPGILAVLSERIEQVEERAAQVRRRARAEEVRIAELQERRVRLEVSVAEAWSALNEER